MDGVKSFELKRAIAIACLLLINSFFLLKYLTRVTNFEWIFTLGITAFYWTLLTNKLRLNISNRILKYLMLGLVLVFIVGASLVFLKVDIHTLNVDRWSVISSFWEATLAGNYPYNAKSHMGNVPGPMPFYYLLASPFYLIGELGYFSLIGLVVMCYLIFKANSTHNYKFLILVFLITSPFYLWEVTVRSNILTTSALIVLFFVSYVNSKKSNKKAFYIYALIAGLLLSTRAVFSIPYIIFFIYDLRKKEVTFMEMSKLVFVAFLSFFTTFLPLLITYYDEFLVMNPFVVQSTFLVPFYYSIFFMILAFVFAFLPKNKDELFYWSGLALFLIISIFIIYNLSKQGVEEFFIGKKADISYFIFCIPFFLMYLLKRNSKPVLN